VIVFTSLIVAVLFAVIFLFGGRAAYRPGQRGRRRFLSLAGGIAVGYVFMHVLPALGEMRHFATESPTGFYGVFPEYSVYLWAMAGFLAFYGLEVMAACSRQGPENISGHDAGETPWQAWVHIGGFALYTWLITYLMVWAEKSTLALCLYAVAMGMHIFPIACNLSSHYESAYNRRGALLLAFASLAGWASGLTFSVPHPILMGLVAVVAGGVIVNTAIAELPKEKEGRYGFFLTGAIVYSALLVILSHFE
jgi:hypothetical protein